jgi:hypothetical protein
MQRTFQSHVVTSFGQGSGGSLSIPPGRNLVGGAFILVSSWLRNLLGSIKPDIAVLGSAINPSKLVLYQKRDAIAVRSIC